MAKLGRESKPLPAQLSDAEIFAGTDTSDRVISAADLKLGAENHAPVRVGGKNTVINAGGVDVDPPTYSSDAAAETALGAGFLYIHAGSGELRKSGDGDGVVFTSGVTGGIHSGSSNNNSTTKDDDSFTVGTQNNFNATDTRFQNTVGYRNNYNATAAHYLNTVGNQNNYNAINAHYQNTVGYRNNYNAINAYYQNTVGNRNNYIAVNTHYQNTVGSQNNYNATHAHYQNTIGYQNNYNATHAHYQNTIGYQNNYNATAAHYQNTVGNRNCYLSADASYQFSTGDRNLENATSTQASFTCGRFNGRNITGTANHAFIHGLSSGSDLVATGDDVFIVNDTGDESWGAGQVRIGESLWIHRDGFLELKQTSSEPLATYTPAANKVKVWFEGNDLKMKDSTGTIRSLTFT